ncbi:MAG: OsmC family protein [Candidatus Izimaplasma sp.]|nr:OsmC family protein [Candidatus Izimaplasma bacterium]
MSALGGCQAIVVAAFAKAHKITYEDFYVDIKGDIDLDGFMGKSDVRPGLQEVRYKIHFKTNEPRNKMEKFVQFVERSCPVGDSIEHAVKFENAGIILE